jgi:hypothetical protein
MNELDELFREIENVEVKYQEVLDKFNWNANYFQELESIILKLAYHNKTIDLEKVKEFIRNRLRKIGVQNFNRFLLAINRLDLLIKNHWDLLEANLNKVCRVWLSTNTNDEAVAILEKNPTKIIASTFSGNSNNKAVELLYKNINNIYWSVLSSNNNDQALYLL